jgi:dipeptidyl aminopeptidase/acylaminoacyl peptidase
MHRFATVFLSFAFGAIAYGSSLDERVVTLPDYAAIPKADQYASKEEYAAVRRDASFRLTRVTYESDGRNVFAYVYAPRTKPATPLPAVVFNRGSYVWKQFAGEYLTTFHRLASAGFVVIAPMYRGSGGASGRDELGGADVEDLLNTASLLRQLPYVNPDLVFMYGESRGAMMTYQAIRERYSMRAAAVYGGFTDLAPLAAPGGKFEKAALMIWPDYEQRKDEIIKRRSAIQWPEQFSVPVLIMHGGSDTDVPPSQSLALAAKLQQLGKPYELIIRSGANHVLTEWRAGRDAHAIDWFRRHMIQ